MAGATDGRYWRERGYPAYGFTPMILDRADIGRVHGIDERISIDNLLLGIKMTKDIIRPCAHERPLHNRSSRHSGLTRLVPFRAIPGNT